MKGPPQHPANPCASGATRPQPTLRHLLALSILLGLAASTAPAQTISFGATNLLDHFVPLSTNLALYGPQYFRSEFSGATIHPLTGELAVVLRSSNSPASNRTVAVQFYTPEGAFLRQVNLTDFSNPDPEGICLVDAAANQYAIADESLSAITILTISNTTTTVSKNAGRTLILDLPDFGNNGIEGITWDAARGCFYAVKERLPMAIYRVTDLGGTNAITEVLFNATNALSRYATDLSDIHYDAHTDRLLILSHESKIIMECTLDGRVLQTLAVGLTQAEGLALSADRTALHAIGEPNHHLRYTLKFQQTIEGTDARVALHLTGDVASNLTTSVDFHTVPISADAISDFTPTNGTIHLTATNRSATISIPTRTDLELEDPERFEIHLTNAVNATIGTDAVARIDIIDPGGFAWAPLTTQRLGEAFAATIRAVAPDGTLLTGFTGTVTIGITWEQPVAFQGIGTAALASPSNSTSVRTKGLRFTPSAPLTVTHLRLYWGDKIALWTDTGDLLVTLNAVTQPGTWQDLKLPVPLTLTPGVTYRLAARQPANTDTYEAERNFPAAFTHGIVNSGCRVNADAFPQTPVGNDYVVDLRYTVVTRVTGNITPGVSGNFTEGAWTGAFTITQRVTNARFQAQDAAGRTAFSNFFDVLLPPLLLLLPPSLLEGAGLLTQSGNLLLPAPAPDNLTVSLSTDRPDLLQLPESLQLNAGDEQQRFDLNATDNDLADGLRRVVVTATAAAYEPAAAFLQIWDDDSGPALFMTIR